MRAYLNKYLSENIVITIISKLTIFNVHVDNMTNLVSTISTLWLCELKLSHKHEKSPHDSLSITLDPVTYD